MDSPGRPSGTATIGFSDCNNASLIYYFDDGRVGMVPLSRLTPNVTCGASGDNGAPAAHYLLSGNWFDPNDGGQGFIFDFSPSIHGLFAAWYTFAQDGQQTGGAASQRWYTLQSDHFTSTALAGIPIIETTGGAFNDPATTMSVQVGTVDLTVQSCTAMTLSYQFGAGENQGLSGTIHLQRVGPAPSGCRL
jgi:hypothetical protein